MPTEEYSRWKSIFSVAEIGGYNSSAAAQAERVANKHLRRSSFAEHDVEHGQAPRPTSAPDKDGITIEATGKSSSDGGDLNQVLSTSKAYKKHTPVHGLNRPLFHIDLTSALQAAIANVEAQYGRLVSSPENPKRGVGTVSDSDSEEVTKLK